MVIQIEPDSAVPIYTQITQQIIEGIARGDIKPGDLLPSVRTLAADLGVNMHTVNKSYHQLEEKGFLQILPKSGSKITSPAELDPLTHERLVAELRPLIAESLAIGMSEEKIVNLVQTIIRDILQ